MALISPPLVPQPLPQNAMATVSMLDVPLIY